MPRLIVFVFPVFLILLLNKISWGQGNNCGDTEPIPICPMDTLLCLAELSDTIPLSTTSNLPDLEFVIIDENLQATNNSGPAIIGIDEDSRFIPNDLGVDSATRLSVFPIAYDKVLIQDLLDDLLHGTLAPPPFDIPCCSLAADLCMTLNDAGIYNGSDFQSLSQLFALFSTDTTELFSQDDLINGIDSINMILDGVPSGCGGGTEICYAFGPSCQFDIFIATPLVVLSAPFHQADTVVVADTIHSTATIADNVSVTYNHTIETLLEAGFETMNNSQFTIETLVCQ